MNIILISVLYFSDYASPPNSAHRIPAAKGGICGYLRGVVIRSRMSRVASYGISFFKKKFKYVSFPSKLTFEHNPSIAI